MRLPILYPTKRQDTTVILRCGFYKREFLCWIACVLDNAVMFVVSCQWVHRRVSHKRFLPYR